MLLIMRHRISYDFILEADDGTTTVTKDIVVDINDVNEAPVLDTITTATLEENQTDVQIGLVSWDDPDNDDYISTDPDSVFDNATVS